MTLKRCEGANNDNEDECCAEKYEYLYFWLPTKSIAGEEDKSGFLVFLCFKYTPQDCFIDLQDFK